MSGYVYFIADGEDGPIKIGYTKANPNLRLAQLQTGNPRKLELLFVMDGDRQWERSLHDNLADYRLAGEWFTRSQKVVDVLEGFRSIYQIVDGLDGSVRWRQ